MKKTFDDNLRAVFEPRYGAYAGDIIGDILIPQIKQAFIDAGYISPEVKKLLPEWKELMDSQDDNWVAREELVIKVETAWNKLLIAETYNTLTFEEFHERFDAEVKTTIGDRKLIHIDTLNKILERVCHV